MAEGPLKVSSGGERYMSRSASSARDGIGGQPDWLEPELATLTSDRFSDPAWLYERKFDGERCLAYRAGDRVRLLTRNQKQVNSTYPELSVALEAQDCADFIVDGEVVAFDGQTTSFSRLQQRLGLHNPGQDLLAAVPVCFYLFDVLWADGRDVRQLPLLERKQVLHRLLSFGDPIRYAEHRTEDGEAYYAYACANGWEGLVVKRGDAPYRAGRSRDWLKFKCQDSQEFVIGGYTDPKGSRTGFGALLLGYYDGDGTLAYAGKVGTGFDRAALDSLAQTLSGLQRPQSPFGQGKVPRTGVHWVEPRLVGQVAFSEWTSAGELRHPRFQGLRRDKDAASVTRERPSASVLLVLVAGPRPGPDLVRGSVLSAGGAFRAAGREGCHGRGPAIRPPGASRLVRRVLAAGGRAAARAGMPGVRGILPFGGR
jgi:bifunctional non-homologous end joining protein LigD